MSKKKERGPQAAHDVIHIVDENLRHGFAQLPRPVLRAKGLSDKAKLVYALLLDYAWRDGSCFPGQKTLATDLDCDDRTIRRALTELQEYELVDWKQRGLSQTNVYYILSVAGNPRLHAAAPIFEPDRSKMSGQDRSKLSGQDRSKMSDKEYSGEEYPVEEDTDKHSKETNSNVSNSKYVDASLSTSARLRGTVDNYESPADGSEQPPGPAGGATPAQAIVRRSHQPAAEGAGFTPGRGRPPKAPDQLAAALQEASEKLNDEQPRSSLTLAVKLWKASGLPIDKFCQRVYQAMAETRQAKVKKPSVYGAGVMNRMPLFFAELERRLGFRDEQDWSVRHAPPGL